MNMVIPDEGKLLLAQIAFREDSAVTFEYVLQMFVNDYTPADDSTLADFDGATFTGGGPIGIARGDLNAPTLVAHVAYVVYALSPTWTCTAGGPETCYGWVLWDGDSDTVIAAQRFDTPRVMDTGTVETLDPFQIGLQTLH